MPWWKLSKKTSSADQEIDARMREDRKKDERTIKVLLLGAGNSGKSTVFRQINRLFGETSDEKKDGSDGGLSTEELFAFKTVALKNIMEAAKSISESCLEEAEELGAQFQPNEDTVELCKKFIEFDYRAKITPEIGEEIKKWWADPAVHVCMQLRKTKVGMENIDYLMKRLDDFMDPDYFMKFVDVSRVRVRTTGMVEISLKVTFKTGSEETPWIMKLIDVGGQRSERKKWKGCFDGINSILYVMSLSAYDYVLFENHTQNCYDETLQLFSDMVSNEAFTHTDFIVFLNKWDLFSEKIKTTAFDYGGKWPPDKAHAAIEVAKYVESLFRQKFIQSTEAFKESGKSTERRVFFFKTCAVDNDGMAEILPKIQHEAIDAHIRRSLTYSSMMI